MIEEIASASPEIIQVRRPISQWDTKPELMLLIALPFERQESKILIGGKAEQGTSKCRERRRLIVTVVAGAQHPVQTRNTESNSHARIHGVLADAAREMREPDSAIQGKPRVEFVLILKKHRL